VLEWVNNPKKGGDNMVVISFKFGIYTDKIKTTVYGSPVEVQKRKHPVSKKDYYNYRIGNDTLGKYYTLKALNKKLKPHKVYVENKRR
jgi:hypothetical protein